MATSVVPWNINKDKNPHANANNESDNIEQQCHIRVLSRFSVPQLTPRFTAFQRVDKRYYTNEYEYEHIDD
jgi:nucleoside-specific outer membrane channel protein Tsx